MASPLLKQGSRGDDVRTLQTFLNNAGYDTGGVDGIFGNKTANAVRQYQQSQGLKSDGIVGNQTWGAINKVSSPAPAPAPKPASTETSVKTNTPSGMIEYNPLTGEQIKTQAENAINPLYNADVEAFKQATERAKQAYQNQIGARQELYNQQRQELQDYYGQTRQRQSDQDLKRGLSRSTIATNNQDRVNANEATNLVQLQRGLESDMENIQGQITMLENQLSDSLKRLDIDKATKIQARIDELTREQEAKKMEITQFNNQYLQNEQSNQLAQNQFKLQQDQFKFQQDQFDWQKYMDQQQLNLSKQKLYSASGLPSKNDPYNLKAAPGANTSKAFVKGNKDQEMYYNRAWDYLQNRAAKNGARDALNYFLAQDMYRNNLGPFWNRIYQDLDTMSRQEDANRWATNPKNMSDNDLMFNY